ncbi:MAG: coproporphyrinogen III oxidase family protein [Nannocystaceae bacterium]|nr:coproporphyrinogen III oxidase family protein [Nannocystaceae bacterium]
MTSEGAAEPSAGLYVHVPFCARRCTYCDFDFEVGRVPQRARYVAGLQRELAARRDELAQLQPRTLYVGGGTPSLLGADGLAALVAQLRDAVALDRLREATCELNPEHVDAAMVAALAACGFDRVSLGVQSLQPAALRQLGRVHTPQQALAAVRTCLAAGLATSVDVIVGWPGQDAALLDADLAPLLDLGVAHLSIYALTIDEPPDRRGAPWRTLVRRGLRRMPDDDVQAELLAHTESMLARAGLRHYEIASYGRAGVRARHNCAYWTWQDYVGLGPSAASARYHDDGGVRRRDNPRTLAAWAQGAPPTVEDLPPEAAAREGLWLGLRQLEGLDETAFARRFGAAARGCDAVLAAAIARGDLERAAGRLRVTPTRWLHHDAIAARLLQG